MAEYERKRNDIAEPLYEVTIEMASREATDPAAFMRFGAAMARMVQPNYLPDHLSAILWFSPRNS